MKNPFTITVRAALAAGALGALAPAAASADELPVPVQVERLDNGLRVVMNPDRTAPTVAIAVYYDVGARVEERGRSGFAHLFEHMMFEGSANVGKGEHFRLISSRGGSFNGTTSEDRTNYFETLPSSAVELGLFLEADRMRSLNVTAENFENQRQTVMEERRQSYENRPYMLSFLRRDELAYRGWFPYEHSTIGDMRDLQAASLADVRAFHDRYYAPDNAVLSVSGDFEPAQLMEMVRRHFGMIPARRAPAWQEPAFPGQDGERTDTMRDPLAQLPGFHVTWHIPARRTPDHYPLEVLAATLGMGESSRLHQLLVKDRELASEVNVYTEDRRGPDLFGVWCLVAQNHTGEEVRGVIYSEIDRIAREGVSARELDKVKNLVRRHFVFGLQSNLARARQLAEFELYDGNAALLRTELDRYLAVTREDVQRVARQYFAASNRTVLDVLPAPRDAAPAPSAQNPQHTPPAPAAQTAAPAQPPAAPGQPSRPAAPAQPAAPTNPAPGAPGAPAR